VDTHGRSILRFVGLRPPAQSRGRACYFATRSAVALAAALLASVAAYPISVLGPAASVAVIDAVIACVIATTYTLAIHCLVGFWSVPGPERTAELLLDSAKRDLRILKAGYAASIVGALGLVTMAVLLTR